MVFVWKTNFDTVDMDLGKVPPSTQTTQGTTKSKSVLKEQQKTQKRLDSLSLDGGSTSNKENTPREEQLTSQKVLMP